MNKTHLLSAAAFLIMMVVSLSLPASAQDAGERTGALKTILTQSKNNLRQYEWIETTTVSDRGDEKSRKQNRCFYGADGRITKVLLTPPPAEEHKHGLRGRIAEAKKEEMTEYMQEAVALVHQYIPPDSLRIQSVKDAGRVSIQLLDSGSRARLIFSDYLKTGDNLTLDMDLNSNRPLAVNVKSYIDSDRAPVTLTVTFGILNDGTSYVSEAVLKAEGKDLQVMVENSGYRISGR